MSHTPRYGVLWVTITLLVGAIPGVSRAQTVRGRITVKNSGQPVANGIAALLDSTGRVVATTLADDAGAFVLMAPAPGPYRARVERVGFRGAITAPRMLAAGETWDLAIAISGDNVSLRGVKVTADRRCVVRPREGLAAAQLWDEARKALAATALTQMAQATARQRRDPHVFTVRLRKFQRWLDPETLAPRRTEAYDVEGESITPFAARDPVLLGRDGYRTADADGGSTYYAPDASVLLSDTFLDAHCFRVEAPRDKRDDLIGLAFEPVPALAHAMLPNGPSRVDVRGVLWLDRATAELRYMDYHYTNMQLDVPTNHVGGQIEFRPLPDGRWSVSRWYIRMPKLERRRVDIDPMSTVSGNWRLILSAIQEEGGEVLEVLPPGSRRAAVASVSGIVFDSLRGAPLSGVRVFLSGTSHAASTGADGRYRIDAVKPGSYRASLLAPRLDTLMLDAPVRELTVSAGEETVADFGIPPASQLFSRWCPGTVSDDTLGVVLGTVRDTSGQLVDGARVAAQWKTFAKPSPDRLAIRERTAESASSRGRFAICGLPADAPVTVRASSGKAQHAKADVRLLPGEVRRVDLSLVPR